MLHLATRIAIVILGAIAISTQSHAADRKLVVAYFAAWGDGPEHQIDNIPGDLLTHLIYAFGKIDDGMIVSADNPHFGELKRLEQKYPHLKTMISLGGWGGSGKFSEIARTDESRVKFANSCAAFVKKFGFDGLDIDWEYPTDGATEPDKGDPIDRPNFTRLIRSVRAALEEQGTADGKSYLLTIAAPAGPQNFGKIEIGEIHRAIDWINVMAYDYTGLWSPITCLNAPLFPPSSNPLASLGADTTLRMYLDAGVPPDKLVLGVPFYGHAFGGVPNIDDGLFQPHDKKRIRPPGEGEWTYRAIAENALGKMAQHWDATAKVPWLFDPATGVMISYDDPESIQIKAEYAREQNLAGVMIWELSQDDEQHSLLKSLNDGLRKR